MQKTFRTVLSFMGTGVSSEFSPVQPIYYPSPIVIDGIVMMVSANTDIACQVVSRYGSYSFPLAVFSVLKALIPVAVYPRVVIDKNDFLALQIMGDATGIIYTAYIAGHYDDPLPMYQTPVAQGY